MDFGLGLPIAQKLSEKAKRVLYQIPSSIKGFQSINDCIIGDGYENVERVEEFWGPLGEIDCFVFPDLGQSDLQIYLDSIGKPVWGSRAGDAIELNREKFLKTLADLGLPVPPSKRFIGLTDLRRYLADKENKYVKISKYRADMETHHWRNKDSDSGWLDWMALKLGCAQDLMPFLVFDEIDAPVEVGGDTYSVDGKFPSLMLHGDEAKDQSYLGAVTKFEDMPDTLKEIMERFSPLLARERFRNQMSLETRGEYYIDPTHRLGLPSTGSQLNTWKNFAEIVLAGAHGELIEPDPAHLFSAECVLKLKGERKAWGKIRIPPKLKPHVKLGGCCEIDGADCFPPDESHGEEVGWLVSGGDTAIAAIEQMRELSGLLPDGLSAATETLFDLLKQIREGEKQGVEFSDQALPKPEEALEK